MRCLILCSLFLLGAVPASVLAARDNALIFPKRVVLGGRTRNAEVTLANQSALPVTYRIELIDQRMTGAGGLEAPPGPEPPVWSAIPLLRYSPRQVTVAPGAFQTVRILLRTPAELAPGEYRAHLLCRALPPADAVSNVEPQGEGKGFGVRIVALPAVSIPVIVRQGEDLHAAVHLSGLAFDAATRSLSFRVEREGPISVFGDLTATFEPHGGGPERRVGLSRGMAVYAERAAIEPRLILTAEGTPPAGGRLRLRFASRPEDDGGGAQVTAEAALEIP